MKRLLIILAAALLSATPSIACTTAIVGAKASRTGRPLLWKQRDSGSNTKASFAYVEGGKYAFTAVFSSKDKDHKSAYGGVNEAGFAIINNVSYHILEKGSKAANGSLMKRALQECATIDEFEKMLLEMEEPRDCASNFGVIDASGAAAYFEAGSRVVKRYDVPEDGWLVRTNYSFAGEENTGGGYARYETAEYVMAHHRGKFVAEDLISGLGRCFRSKVLGRDFLKKGGYAWDEDFIPRPSTSCSLCVEGMIPGDKPGSAVMWCAPGYTPACYSIPVWVAAGAEIAKPLSALEDGNSPMNVKGEQLRLQTHDLPRDAAGKYINIDKARSLVKRTKSAEAVEMKEGRALTEKFRAEGFSLEAVKAFNEEAEKRFKIWESR